MARKFVYWPERQRCYRCRLFFGPLVVLGLYCSYECARKPNPYRVPRALWPREHWYGPAREPKRAFYALSAAQAMAKATGKDAYLCNFCWTWHIGSPSPLTKTLVRWSHGRDGE